ncbi:MAG: addiction module protein [Bacteroidota bacterium]|nr:addiction module protein [Bacteroidota bacterium]
MSVAQDKIQLAQRLLQTEDKNILKAIELIFTQEDEHFELSASEKRELDRRLADVESGNAKFYTMAEVKKMVRKKSKK